MNKIYITQNNIDQILDLNQWPTLGLNPTKGILFLGKVGVGKTTILRKLASLHDKICWGHPKCPAYSHEGIVVDNPKTINAKSVNKLYENWGSKGLKIVKSYDMFLDDIGSEETFVNHFGTKISPVEDLLFDRNENKSLKTFATSNLNLDRLKSVYGERMGDRWAEMFNIVIIEGESRR
jgi:DNA replication protein DnaC